MSKKQNSYPWLMVLCCCGMLTASFGLPVYCAGLFYVPVADTLGAKLGEVALMLTLMNITHGLLSPAVIRISGKTDIRIMAATGMLGISAGFYGLSRVTAVWQLYCWAVFIGVFCACCGLAIVPVILGNWFQKKSGMAIGIVHCVSGLAGAVMAPVLKRIMVSSSWRSAYVCIAVICFLVLIPAVIFLRFKPAGNGEAPAGNRVAAVSDEKKADGRRQVPGYSFKLALMCLIAFLATFGPGFGVHMSGFTESIGIAPSVSALLYSTGLIGGTVSKLVTGISCDRIGAGKTSNLILAVTVAGLGLCLILSADMIPLFVLAALLIGIGTSMSGVGIAAITRQVFGRDFAVAFSWVSIAAAIGSSSSGIVGFMVDRFHSYFPAIILCMVFGCISMVLITLICRVKDDGGRVLQQ